MTMLEVYAYTEPTALAADVKIHQSAPEKCRAPMIRRYVYFTCSCSPTESKRAGICGLRDLRCPFSGGKWNINPGLSRISAMGTRWQLTA
jgi:hypothetical protein